MQKMEHEDSYIFVITYKANGVSTKDSPAPFRLSYEPVAANANAFINTSRLLLLRVWRPKMQHCNSFAHLLLGYALPSFSLRRVGQCRGIDDHIIHPA